MDDPHIRIAVRDYIDREVERATKQTERQFVTVETARVIAESAIAGRLEDMNKFREENRHDATTFVRKDVYAKDIEKIESHIAPLLRGEARLSGAADVSRFTLERLMAGAAIALALYSIVRP